LHKNLAAIEKKMAELEEDFYLNRKVPENTYTRLVTKLLEKKQEILKNYLVLTWRFRTCKNTLRPGSPFPRTRCMRFQLYKERKNSKAGISTRCYL
jgi:hypothetical protein